MLGEPKNQFSLTRVALSTGERAKSNFLSITPVPTNLKDTLLSANATLDPLTAHRLYSAVREGARNSLELLPLFVSATRELAYLSTKESDRSTLWRDAYTRLSAASDDPDILFLEQAAILLKDIIVDECSGVDISFQGRELANLLKLLSARISAPDAGPNIRSRLLARRSSLLRLRSERFDISSRTKRTTLEEALRCAEKAVSESETTGAQFELALCLWANSNSSKTDEDYRAILQRVEKLLVCPHILEIDVAKLTLARFYRMIYRPLEACEMFDKLTESVSHRRRILIDAAVYAEASIHLWFQEFPVDTWRTHCESALFLTREAIDSGYRNARMLVNVAYLHEILGDRQAARTSLREIADVPEGAIWDKLIAFSLSAEGLDEATEGLCFGMTNGLTWTRLGTYAWTFLEDARTAQTLYEFAVKLSPRNPIALTNLARFHLRHGANDFSRLEAERLLQRASSYAGRRFRWWRLLMDELRSGAKERQDRECRPLVRRREELAIGLPAIKSRYKQVCGLEDLQRRGYELECLVFDLANISFTVATPSYRFKRGDDAQTQIDGYIEHRSEKYRVECKWEREPVSKDHFIKFFDALDVAGISGLFVSMSGYSPSFLQRAREYRKERAIILLDREDIESAVNGRINFDELLTFKRQSFDRASEPYAKPVPFQD